jgi:hypothetical protein
MEWPFKIILDSSHFMMICNLIDHFRHMQDPHNSFEVQIPRIYIVRRFSSNDLSSI